MGRRAVTYLGLQTAGFPNLLMLAGPQAGSGFTNFGRGIEEAVDWTTALLAHAPRPRPTPGSTPPPRPRPSGSATWGTCTTSCCSARSKSWFTGYNSNVEGHDTIRPVAYNGGAPRYRKRLAEVAENGYEGFVLD